MSQSGGQPRSREALFEQMGALAQETWSDEVSAAENAAEKARFQAALASDSKRRIGRRARLAVALAAVVACAAAVVVALVWPSRLEYSLTQSSSNVGGYLQAGSGAPATAHFSDGTDVRVAPGGRARVVETDSHGARVALEQGRATLSVVHRAGARWSVEAGPFSITVTGTEFDAEWSGADERLVVELRKGSVVVRGPLATGGIGLSAGQRLVASVRDGQIHIEPLAPAKALAAAGAIVAGSSVVAGDTTATPGANTMAAPATPSGDTTAAPSIDVAAEPGSPPLPSASSGASPIPSSSASPEAEKSWEKRVRSGQFASVVTDAEARGIDSTLHGASESDLTALADAARYTGKVDVAASALLAVQKRFPGTADAKAASFLLGRLAEGRGARAEAMALYDRYLAESPRGPFVAEALGRKMLAAQAQSGTTAARGIARDYLVRFPKGPYADKARKLVDSE